MNGNIELRADAPPYTVAMRLVERLGFRLLRNVNRIADVQRPALAGDESVPLTVSVVERRRTRPGILLEGYDVHLMVFPRRKQAETEAEARRLFEEVCQVLGYPTLLRLDAALDAAWSPRLGPHRFPPKTFGEEEDRERWADYALPRVSDEIRVAPDDVLGQLYARIVADPDDDEPRLAYADAVEPEYPDYARLIRLQVQYTLDRKAGNAWDPGRVIEMNRLEREYNRAVRPFWAPVGREWHVRRGFVEAAVVKAGWLIRWAGELVATVPLRMVYLIGEADERIGELAALPQLARLRGLSFWGNPIGDAGLRRFLSSPYLGGLRWLDLQNCGVTATGIEELAASDALPELRYVAADRELRLNPVPGYDFDGSLVHVDEGYLGLALAQRYDREWLRWRPKSADEAWEPEYGEL